MTIPADTSNLQQGATVPERLWRIWAKWSKTGNEAPEEGETYHPLICHMIDVAVVARQLWGSAMPGPTRARLTEHLGLVDEGAAAAWIAFFTGLHDLGKASPGFQDELSDRAAGETIRAWMREASLDCTEATWAPHGVISARVLGYTLEDLGVGVALADQIAALVGGHHGIFPRQGELNDLKERQQIGTGAWEGVRQELVATLRTGLSIPDPAPRGVLTPADALVFAGFVTVADWIGSNELYFHHAGRRAAAPEPMALAEYVALAEECAAEALRAVRMDPFVGVAGGRVARTFAELFPSIPEPRDAQTAVIEMAERRSGPALVILEAPMGEGKTEAALYLAEAWSAAGERQGAYIALPTQATSNQMFKRVYGFLGRRFADADYVAAHLATGEAAFDAFYQKMLAEGRTRLEGAEAEPKEPIGDISDAATMAGANGEDEARNVARDGHGAADETLALEREGPVYDGRGAEAGAEGAVIAAEWFAAPKRAMLAPFGVGTIDQALLGVLQTKHFFVRLFGLSGKTVIVDEVHAYDTYMSSLLVRLLEWLGAFGVPVVLLSATLPKAKRDELRRAYARFAGWPEPADNMDTAPYPRLTWTGSDGTRVRGVKTSAEMSRAVELEWLEGSAPDTESGLNALRERLAVLLADGGCAAVVCNTVRRAQQVYTSLKPSFQGNDEIDGMEVLDLFHAGFPRGEPIKREERALKRFGRGTDIVRPKRAVLVATQVIEQSLDLDFDLMVSDLAPMDLLLQRSGRLHRHRENDVRRPKAVGSPRLIVPLPEVRDECPVFPRSDEFVYDAHYLLRTWLALRTRARAEIIRVPEEIEDLVEWVYDRGKRCPDDAPAAVRDAWERTRRQYERDEEHDLDEARVRRVAAPKGDDVYTGRNLKLKPEDESPDAEKTVLALTRLGPPSVRVVVLPEAEARREWDATGKPPDIRAVRRLLSQSVGISHGAVAPELIKWEPPRRWKRSPWLRHVRLLGLNANSEATIEVLGKEGRGSRVFTLKLDAELGVSIRRRAKEDG